MALTRSTQATVRQLAIARQIRVAIVHLQSLCCTRCVALVLLHEAVRALAVLATVKTVLSGWLASVYHAAQRTSRICVCVGLAASTAVEIGDASHISSLER